MERPDDTEPKNLGSASPEQPQAAADSAVSSSQSVHHDATHADQNSVPVDVVVDTPEADEGSSAGASPADGYGDSQAAQSEPKEADFGGLDSSEAESDPVAGQNVFEEDTPQSGDGSSAESFAEQTHLPSDDDTQDTALYVDDVLADAAEATSEKGASEESVDGAAGSELEQQLAERTEDLQRLSAEYANYRRRTERERAAISETAANSVVLKLLPILDDLDLAKQHGDMHGALKALADKLNAVMQELNVTAFGVVGEEFNPELHEAVQDTSTGDEKALGVVLRKGYRAGERVLRTAMVVVGDPAGSEAAGS